jgi:hypothetical protein
MEKEREIPSDSILLTYLTEFAYLKSLLDLPPPKPQTQPECVETKQSPSFHNRLIDALGKVTAENVLVVRCDNINQRSAINRLAFLRGYATCAISSHDFTENYICSKGQRRVSFAEMKWHPGYGADADYEYGWPFPEEQWEGPPLIYYTCNSFERHDDLRWNEVITDLDYNAVAVYPKMPGVVVVWLEKEAFLQRKREVTRPTTRRVKGSDIKTDELELALINGIREPRFEFCPFAELFARQ